MIALEEELATLETLSPEQLRAEWSCLYKADAPKLPATILRHGIGFRLQERCCRGPKSTVERELRRIASGKATAPGLKAGARLIRSWNDRNIEVLVADDGFIFEGRRYRSLSAIAREVTGAHWSGPRFFGLTGHG